ncbi:MAG: oligosaccharide flippase family protein [Chitinophagaceae bacterium]|nr:oligosaccharide flippase family protein [Chitinophagaceae bacterium]
MGIIKRQSFKTTVVHFIGVTLGMVFLNFIFPHIILPEYLGLVGLIQSLVVVFSSITILGLPHLLVRQAGSWNSAQTKGFHTFSIILISLAVLLFVAFYLLFQNEIKAFYGNKSVLFYQFYYLIIPLVLIYSLYQYLEMFSLSKFRTAFPSFIREILYRILIIISFLLIFYKVLSYASMSWIFITIYLVPFLLLLFYNIGIHDFSFGNIKSYWNQKSSVVKEELVYSLYMVMLVLTTNLMIFVDSLMLPAYLGLAQLAIYLRPQILGNLVNIPYRAVAIISHPILRSKIINEEWQELKQLHKSISLNLFLIGCLLAVALLCNVDAIFSLLPPSYQSAKSVLYIITIARLLDMAFGLNSELLIQSQFFKTNVYFSFLSMLLGVILNMLLIPSLGIAGAAWGVLFSVLFFNILKTLLIYRKFKFHCFSASYASICLITVAVFFTFYFVPEFHLVQHHMFMNSLLNIVLRGSASLMLFTTLAYLFKISPDFSHLIQTILSGKIFKGGYKMSEL